MLEKNLSKQLSFDLPPYTWQWEIWVARRMTLPSWKPARENTLKLVIKENKTKSVCLVIVNFYNFISNRSINQASWHCTVRHFDTKCKTTKELFWLIKSTLVSLLSRLFDGKDHTLKNLWIKSQSSLHVAHVSHTHVSTGSSSCHLSFLPRGRAECYLL